MLGSHFGEGISGVICGAFAAPIGIYAGFKGGVYLTELALKKIYPNKYDPAKQSHRSMITKGIGGVVGAFAGGIFAGICVTAGATQFFIWRAKRY